MRKENVNYAQFEFNYRIFRAAASIWQVFMNIFWHDGRLFFDDDADIYICSISKEEKFHFLFFFAWYHSFLPQSSWLIEDFALAFFLYKKYKDRIWFASISKPKKDSMFEVILYKNSWLLLSHFSKKFLNLAYISKVKKTFEKLAVSRKVPKRLCSLFEEV